MDTKILRDIIATANRGSKKLQINGYVSESRGGPPRDLQVQLGDQSTYLELVKLSMEMAYDLPVPDGVALIDWSAAAKAKCDSWAKTLAGAHEPKKKLTTTVHADGYETRDDLPDRTILRHVVRLDTPPPVESDASLKEQLASLLPIGRYIGQLNLDREKYASAHVL